MKHSATLLLFVLMASVTTAAGQRAGGPPALKIVVIAGENAVNVIQTKTAVAPLVEVRDRNDQPIAGVPVTFAMTSGGSSAGFAGGAQTVTVVTNAAGRAVATGFTPTAAGQVQLNVTAAFQGQTATATITQTNFATAAQAAQAANASSASGAGGGGGGAGAGASGAATAGAAAAGAAVAGAGAGSAAGLSTVAIGAIAGGAVAGGIIAKNALSDGDGGEPRTLSVTGPFSGPFLFNLNITGFPCNFGYTTSGTLALSLTIAGNNTISGTGTVTVNFQFNGLSGDPLICPAIPPGPAGQFILPITGITGTSPTVAFDNSTTQNFNDQGFSGSYTQILTFSGALNGNTLTGTMNYGWNETCNFDGCPFTANGTYQVTLR